MRASIALFLIAACGGSTGPSAASAGGAAAASCPSETYCADRCSGKDGGGPFDASCTMPACPCLPAPRTDWAGTYHLTDVTGATLVIEADGSFRWSLSVNGPVTAMGSGAWKKSQPHTIVLVPAANATSFDWLDDSAQVVRMNAPLNVTGDPGGDIVVQIPHAGVKPSAQRWKR